MESDRKLNTLLQAECLKGLKTRTRKGFGAGTSRDPASGDVRRRRVYRDRRGGGGRGGKREGWRRGGKGGGRGGEEEGREKKRREEEGRGKRRREEEEATGK